jgi:16S rRNA (uracil1498-N3)-methyltransferase
MHRFFAPAENIKDKIVISDKTELHHLKNVLRLKRGEEVIVFDGKGNECRSRIESLDGKEAVMEIIERKEGAGQNDLSVCLACALPKKSKFDFIVEKATELGADRIIPLKTSRTIVDLKKEREERKVRHWQEICVNASKQSQRNRMPAMEKIFTFSEALQEAKRYDLALIPCLTGERKKIEAVLRQFKGKSIMVFIGPEGDFTSDEVSRAVKAGCQPVTLGDLVLRVDSAAFYTLAVIKFVSQMR